MPPMRLAHVQKARFPLYQIDSLDPSGVTVTADGLLFTLASDVPEPSGIAVVITAASAVSAMIGRRRYMRRRAGASGG